MTTSEDMATSPTIKISQAITMSQTIKISQTVTSQCHRLSYHNVTAYHITMSQTFALLYYRLSYHNVTDYHITTSQHHRLFQHRSLSQYHRLPYILTHNTILMLYFQCLYNSKGVFSNFNVFSSSLLYLR